MILPLPLMATNLGWGGKLVALPRSQGSAGPFSQQQCCIVAQHALTMAQDSSETELIGVDKALKGASSITASARQSIQTFL